MLLVMILCSWPSLAIVLGDLKTWALDVIQRVLVTEGVGLYYAVRFVQRDFINLAYVYTSCAFPDASLEILSKAYSVT